MNPVLAVDLGGAKTAIALVDDSGHFFEKEKLPAAASLGASIERIFARCRAPIAAAGVIVPGIYDPSAGTAWAPNLWGRKFHPVRAALEQRLGAPTTIGSDRTGSVLAEQWLGVPGTFGSKKTALGEDAGLLGAGRLAWLPNARNVPRSPIPIPDP